MAQFRAMRRGAKRSGQTMTRKTAWILTDGRAGMRGPALGLAEAAGLAIVEKRIVLAKPWLWLPTRFWPHGVSGLGPGSDPVDPPYPDVVISCGRRAVGPARWLRARSRGRIFAVHILRPYVDPAQFDLVIAPAHDRLSGPNVLSVIGSLNRVTTPRLAESADRFATTIGHLPRPRIAVLIGGPNRVYRFDAAAVDRLAGGLRKLAHYHGAGFAITASRRTGPAMIARLRSQLGDAPTYIWDGTGENPYFGLLGLADAIVVTGDSVNMISEACTTGKPVYVFELGGGDRTKFAEFHEAIYASGQARPFDRAFAIWRPEPLRETERAARLLLEKLSTRAD